MGLYDASKSSATIIGAGGIGATTALVLAKMGVGFLTVYDDDIVGQENIATQLHQWRDIGKSKVQSLSESLALFSDDIAGLYVPSRVTSDTNLRDMIVISAVDSIRVRKDIWQAVRLSRPLWYLDARMSAEEFHLFSVEMSNENHVDLYDRKLDQESDEGIPEIPCTMKATFFTSAVAAGLIGSTVRKIISDMKVPRSLVFNMTSNLFFSG